MIYKIEDIHYYTCLVTNIGVRDIFIKNTTNANVEKRHLFIYLCQTLTNLSQEIIVNYINKNSLTDSYQRAGMSHAKKKINDLLWYDVDLKKKIKKIKAHLDLIVDFNTISIDLVKIAEQNSKRQFSIK